MVDRPAPAEGPSPGPVTTPRQAAAVILLRGGAEALEVLLLRRNPEQRFMGGYWVFPGGAVDGGEGEGDAAHRAAAVRELAEEAGVTGIPVAALVKHSRWITPEQLSTRFDTHFFLVHAPPDARPRPDGRETVALRWTTPRDALEDYRRGTLELVFPTVRQLEELAGYATADEAVQRNRGRDPHPILPRVVLHGDVPRVLLPGEPGYDDA